MGLGKQMRAQVTGTRLGQKANLNLYIVNLAQSLQAANWGIGESLTLRANHWCQNWGIGESLVLKLENWGILLPLWRIIVTKVGELNFRESNFGESNFIQCIILLVEYSYHPPTFSSHKLYTIL